MSRSKRKVNKHVPRRRMLKEPPPKVSGEISLGRETAAVFFFVLSLFLALSLYSFLAYPPGQGMPANSGFLRAPNIMGEVGLATARLLFRLLGWCSFVTVLWSLLLARTIWNDGWPACSRSLVSLFVSTSALFVAAASCAGVASLTFGSQGGGALGSAISVVLVRLVNEPGTVLFCSALFVLSIGVATGSGTGLVVALTQWIVGLGVAGAAWGGRLFSRGFYRGVCVLLVLARRAIREVFYLPVRLVRGLGSPFWRAKAGAQHAGAQSAGPAWVAGIKPEEKGTATASPAFVMAGAGEAPAKASGAAPLILRRSKLGQKKTASPVKPLRKKGARPDKADALKEKGRSGAKSKCGEPEKEFVLPNTDLLVSGEAGAGTSLQDTDLIKNSKKLEVALANFRIGGRVTEVHPGPVITLYQFEPAAGIKVQRIVNLADDLALALKVESVRVYAPVPGKGAVGIEVPNAHREIVRLREVLESEEFQTSQAPLTLALGKDTYGEPYAVTLAKMPHLLIAGATGTGKSVCINSLLMSLLFRYSPKELQLVLIDPKMLELSVYEGIPHLKAPVITQPKRARGVLWWAVEEMERRYQLMKTLGVRDLSMYNRLVGDKAKNGKAFFKQKPKKDAVIELEEKDVVATGSPNEGLDRGSEYLLRAVELQQGVEFETLARIVIVVDELADLMLTVGREIEELLTRLAQKGRAAGLHIVLATQRPSVNVITGLIKANFPARISFKVASKIDARTVMDTPGADKLLGMGDMLFMSPHVGSVRRLHSPYVSDKEVHDVVDWLRAQGGPNYDAAIEKMIERLEEAEAGSAGAGGDDGEYDALYDQAVNLVIEKGFASTSMVQRVFRIGYNRAARILETMEREGVVGPADGAKPRQVLVGNASMG